MHTSIKELLEKNKWCGSKSSSQNDIDLIEATFKTTLPNDYKELLQFSNGGALEGFETPFIIYTIKEVIILFKEYDFYKNIPNSLIFGGDGGGTLYCHDLRNEKATIFFVKEDNIDYEKSIFRSSTLTSTILKIINNEKLNLEMT